jgi:hypothetical protein
VLDADVGTPRIERLSDTRAIANVVTRTDDERWGALTMKLDASTGRWRAASIQRLYAARHYRTGPYPAVVEVPVERRIATAAQDRDRAGAALQASQPSADRPTSSRAPPRTGDQTDDRHLVQDRRRPRP